MGRKLYSFVHFEAVVPSTVYFLELEQDPQNGALKVIQQMVRTCLCFKLTQVLHARQLAHMR